MSDFINSLLGTTVGAAAVTVLCLIVRRLADKKYRPTWRYIVWLAVALRMIIPVNPSLPKAVTAPMPRAVYISAANIPQTHVFQQAVGTVGAEIAKSSPVFSPVPIIFEIWLIGALIFLAYHIVNVTAYRCRLARWSQKSEHEALFHRLCTQMNTNARLFVSDVDSPVTVGFFKPTVYLPKSDIPEVQLELMLRHELVHIRRHDLLYKCVILLANAMHWFNPLAYAMRRASDCDLELICDTKVLENAADSDRTEYARALVTVMKQRAPLSAKFSGGAVKSRVEKVLDATKKRRGVWIAFALAVCAVCAGFMFGCSREDTSAPSGTPSQTESPDNANAPIVLNKIKYVGNASEVGKVRAELSRTELAVGFEPTGGMELFTTDTPYGAKFSYTHSEPLTETDKNRIKAMAGYYITAIGNLGWVTLNVNGSDYTFKLEDFDDLFIDIKTESLTDYIHCASVSYKLISAATPEELFEKTLVSFFTPQIFSGNCEFLSTSYHILMQNDTAVYALATGIGFGYMTSNGKEYFIANSGLGCPCRMDFTKNGDVYTLDTFKVPMDGGMWLKSVQELFPKELHKEITNDKYKYAEELRAQVFEKAHEYLRSQGSDAVAAYYGDIEVTLLSDVCTNVEATNELIGVFGEYPYFIGSQKDSLGNTRSVDFKDNVFVYTKTSPSGEVLEYAEADVSGDSVVYRNKKGFNEKRFVEKRPY